jgi:hypothetical protein
MAPTPNDPSPLDDLPPGYPTLGGVPLLTWTQSAGLVLGLLLGGLSGALVGGGLAWALDKDSIAERGKPLITL